MTTRTSDLSRAALSNLLAMILWITSQSSIASPPQISNVSLRGLQIGETTTLTIDGNELLPNPSLVLPFEVIHQTVASSAQNNRVQVAVTVGESVQPGIYKLRVANSKGISNAVQIGVDSLIQKPFSAAVESLPIALHANLTGGQILKTVLNGKKGQRIVVDVEAKRLGSNLKPVARLYDARGTQIAWSPPTSAIGGDARFHAICQSDGPHSIELHDVLYRGAAPGFFRLKVGDLKCADMAFPIGVSRSTKTEVRVLPEELATIPPISVDGGADLPVSHFAPPLQASQFTGPRPSVLLSDHDEITESPSSDGLQMIAAPPIGINGCISKSSEEDKYLLAVKPGSKLRFDVFASRIGSQLDGVLILRGEKGNELARNDDRPGISDPGMDFNVPSNLNKLLVSIQDIAKRGGDSFVYRIGVRHLAKPDFRLSLDTDRVNIPIGGSQFINVQVERTAYDGPIQLSIAGLPESIQVSGNTIASDATIGLIILSTPPGQSAAGLMTVIGESSDGTKRAAEILQPNNNEVFRDSELGFAVAEQTPINIQWGEFDDKKLFAGSTRRIPITLTRNEGVKGPLRVRLLTTQVPPKKKIKKDNKEQTVDDIERTLRIENAEFGPESTGPSVALTTPTDLPQRDWTLVLVAELLSDDKKQVLASAYTQAKVLPAVQPIRLELSGPNMIEAKASDGDTGKLTGRIVRMSGFTNPVMVKLDGLPDGYPSPEITLTAGKDEFVLPVRFPKGTKAADLKNVKLLANALVDQENPSSVIRSNAINVSIKVVAGN